jgi:error-prone DNA polymerase
MDKKVPAKCRIRSSSRSRRSPFTDSPNRGQQLIAYMSAYLKCHTSLRHRGHPQQSTDEVYSPATLVKDAQRHGLRIRPIDVTKSDWLCTLKKDFGLGFWMRAFEINQI